PAVIADGDESPIRKCHPRQRRSHAGIGSALGRLPMQTVRRITQPSAVRSIGCCGHKGPTAIRNGAETAAECTFRLPDCPVVERIAAEDCAKKAKGKRNDAGKPNW